jgi:hypothetical protein
MITFDPERTAALPPPVRRYFAHAIRAGAPLPERFRLAMTGRVKVGLWLPFTAEQETGRDGFRWTARVCPGLVVTDRYADGAGATEGRLGGRLRVFGAADESVARSAAGRAALEAVAFAPACLLAGVSWRAEDEERIVASLELPPERPEVAVRLGPDGAVREIAAQRWREDGYVRCACTVHAERAFGAFTIPSRITVAWAGEPFFRAKIRALAP